MKAGSADVLGQGTADLVDASLELSDVSSVDVSEYGPKESRDRTDGSDEIHDLHWNFLILSHGLKGSRGATRHRRGNGRRSSILSTVLPRLPVRPAFSETPDGRMRPGHPKARAGR